MIQTCCAINPRLSVVPTIRIADEERLTDSIDRAAALIGKDVFYLKVGELLYNKGGMISDGAIAGRRIDEVVHEKDEKHKRVINPMVGELVSMMGQVEEFKEVRAQFMMQRRLEGATIQQAKKESEEIGNDTIEKAKVLKKERAIRKHKVLEEIEKKIPPVDGVTPEIRAKILTDYINTHREELIVLAERYTLEEIQAEVEYYGGVPVAKRGFHETLLNCIRESDVTEHELEIYTAEGIGRALTTTTEALNRALIPGYAAWASGGDVTEVISSATSDIVLTIVGGKVIKVAWQGSKALYQGAKTLGKELSLLGKVQTVERQLFLEQPLMVEHHLFNKFWRKSEQSLQYRRFFEKHGINVDDYCVRIPATTHRKQIHGQGEWTFKLQKWIDENPETTTKEVYQFMGKMMDDFKISHVPIMRYSK